MRRALDKTRLNDALDAMCDASRGPGCIYLVGGASALLLGWRNATIDLDVRLDPEPPGVFEAIRRVKDAAQINVELADPSQFIPEVPGWHMRSRWIRRRHEVDLLHYDFVSQALAKVERFQDRDVEDVREMLRLGLVTTGSLWAGFAAIRGSLIRYPALSERRFVMQLEALVGPEAP